MEINEQQRDALTELINIGFGRAASALSILVGRRVLIEAPDVELFPLGALSQKLTILSDGEVTTVNQVFTGRISGAAMLLMDAQSTASLVDLLSGGTGQERELEPSDREAMQETGNILLNAFTGSFGNLLQVHISFAVPQVRYMSMQDMLKSLMVDQRSLEYALVVRVNFTVTQGNVSGFVVIVMGIQSMEALIEAMRAAGYID